MSGEFREVAHGVEASGTTEGEHTLSWMRADRAADAAGATEQPFTPTEKAFLDFFSQPTETLAATIKGMY
ncbi:MAG: hypothetical protein J2P36_27025, partial [Ktedonobacteraceae bacterium]|nr:hypothetical protein [Ktedonobacteraceae bacterium]